MKLKLFRYSGQPVLLESRQAYHADYQSYFDKADERARTKHSAGAYTDAYALLMQRYLRFGEYVLNLKHNKQIEMELPKSAKAWSDLIAKFDDVPVMVARVADGKSVVMVIMDTLNG